MLRATRRDFLKYAAIFSAGTAIAACAPAQPTAAPVKPAEQKPAEAPKATQPPAAAPAPKGQIELRYMERGDPLGDFMRHASREFEKKFPNVKIVNEPAGWGDLTTKVPTMVAAGTMADLAFQHGALMLPELAAKGVWLNLEPLAEKDKHDFSIYYKWAIDTLRQGPKGELVAMPMGVHLGQNELMWNREMLQKFGLPEPNDKMKTSELVELFKKAQEKMPQNAFAVHWPSGLWTNECISRSFGGYIISQDRKKCGFSLPKTQDGHKWVWDLVNTHKVMPKQDQILKNATSMFYTEMLAFVFNCSANVWVGFTEAVAGKFTLGHCTWPRGDTNWGVTPSCDACVAYGKTKYPDECWQFLKFQSSFEISKWTAVSKSHMTPGAVIAAWNDKEVWEACPPYKNCALAWATIDWGKLETWVMPVPANTRRGEFDSKYGNEWNGMLYGQRPYDQANVEALQKDLQAIMDKPMP